jgi:small-conductance mechanosensitive channel
VSEFVDQYLAQHELRKRIFRRFRAEEIKIPFPQRVVHIREAEGRRLTPAASDASPAGSGKDAIPSRQV